MEMSTNCIGKEVSGPGADKAIQSKFRAPRGEEWSQSTRTVMVQCWHEVGEGGAKITLDNARRPVYFVLVLRTVAKITQKHD